MEIRLKRIYDEPPRLEGFRALADRLWPRGIRKREAAVDLWCRPLAPSDELRRWFAHDPAKWLEFQERYFRELEANTEHAGLLEQLMAQARSGDLVLLYAAKDTSHNNAVALKAFLEARLR